MAALVYMHLPLPHWRHLSADELLNNAVGGGGKNKKAQWRSGADDELPNAAGGCKKKGLCPKLAGPLLLVYCAARGDGEQCSAAPHERGGRRAGGGGVAPSVCVP